jgi:hypothetical protein
MQEVFTEKYFINPAIEYGIRSYKQAIEGMSFDRIYTFEMNVMYALSIIYGEKTILLPYKIDNEMAFKCNLLMYGLKESTMESFIKYMNEYYVFMKNYKSERKATGLINEIEHILIDMITKRNLKKKFRPEELNEFDKIFNPTNGELKQLKQLVGSDQGLIVREWAIQKEEITNTQLKLRAINPNLLDPRVYFKYGYDIKTIAELTDNEIDEVNTIIIKEENKDYGKKEYKKLSARFALSTGSIMVDILLILSILSTSFMIGLVLFSTIWG